MTRIFLGSAILVGAVATGAASAEEIFDLGTLTLEAERREDTLAGVPIATTLVTRQDIEDAGIRDLRDVAEFVPNFTLTTNASRTNPNYFIRGIGAIALVDPGAQQAVATYVDGVYQPFATALIFDFADVERVEVLRGPQGTLYGRNATAGSVNIYTQKPQGTFGARGALSFGTDDYRNLEASVNAPFQNGRGGVRLSVLANERDGFITNGLGADLSAEESRAARLRVTYDVTDRLNLDFIAGYERIRDSGYAYVPIARVFQRTYNTPLDSRDDRNGFNVSLRTTYDFDAVRLTSVTAWQEYDSFTQNPQDILFGFPSEDLGFALSTEDEEGESFLQELLLQSTTGGPWDWTLGLYYENTEVTIDTGSRFTPASMFPFGFETFTNPTTNETEVFAVFADTSFAVTDRTTLTFGGRYTWESIDWTSASVFDGAEIPFSRQSDSADFEGFTPRAVVEYQATDSTLLYGSIARGFKGGGFTTFNAGAPPTQFKPEFVLTYELGAKYLSPDGQLFLGGSVFYNDWDDLQVFYLTTVGGVTTRLVSNADAARSYGAEIEARWAPTSRWQLGGSIGYLDAKLTDVINPLNGASLASNDVPFSPDWTLGLSGQYTMPLTTALDLRLRADLSYSSSYFFDVLNTQQQSDVTLLNLTAEVQGDTWSAGISIRNALDEDYFRWRFNSGGQDFAAAAEPLAASVFLRARF